MDDLNGGAQVRKCLSSFPCCFVVIIFSLLLSPSLSLFFLGGGGGGLSVLDSSFSISMFGS